MNDELYDTDPRLLLLSKTDNVLVACETLPAGKVVIINGKSVALSQVIELGHKLARVDLDEGATIIKYGAPIGSTSAAVSRGAWLHTHNMRSDYIPTYGTDVGDQPMDGH